MVTGLLPDLGDQNIADHDFGHPFGELQDVVPDPLGCRFVGSERFICAVEHADGNEHVRPPIEQIVAPETRYLSHQRHKAFPHAPGEFLRRATPHLVLSDTGEHVPGPRSASGTGAPVQRPELHYSTSTFPLLNVAAPSVRLLTHRLVPRLLGLSRQYHLVTAVSLPCDDRLAGVRMIIGMRDASYK